MVRIFSIMKNLRRSYFNEKSYYNTCITEIISIDTTKKTFYICRDDSNHNFDLMHAELKYLTYKTGGLTYFWDIASDTDINTEGLSCPEEGKPVSGIKNPQKQYLCDRGSFREAKEIEIVVGLGCTPHTYGKFEILKGTKSYLMCDSLFEGDTTYFYWDVSPEKNQGTMTDPRDSSVYKTIIMDTLTWMAENLNYADSVNYPSMRKHNWCYNNQIDSCKIHGRLYTWSAAIDSVYWSTQGITCGHTSKSKYFRCGLPERVQGICPVGWHLPYSNEWIQLLDWLEKINTEFGRSGFFTGHDGIYFSTYAHFANIHYETYFWTSTDVPSTPYDVMMLQTSPISTKLVSSESVNAISVRCVKDY